MSTPANPLSATPPIVPGQNPAQQPAQMGVFQKIGLALPGIANRLAAAFGNYAPLHEEQRQQQLSMQQQLQNSTLQDQALNRQLLTKQIGAFQTPQEKADLEVNTQGRIHDLNPPASEINVDPGGQLTRDQWDRTSRTWSPQTHQVPNPALAPYNEPATNPKPNYVTDWNAGPPPTMPTTVPEPVHPLPPAPMLGVTYGPAVQDANGQWVQSVRNKLAQPQGTVPLGGTPTAAVPTTNITQTSKVEKDVNGNLVNVPETSTTTRTKGNSRSALTPRAGAGQATPITGADGTQLHAPLGADAKKTLRQVSTSEQMLNSIMPDLTQAVSDIGHGSNIYDATQTRASWLEYNKGLDPNNIDPNSPVSALPGADPRITKMFPAIAMMKVVLAQPFMNNSRNFQFMQQIQQHVPDPEKDTPQLMLSKAQWIQKSLPMIKRAVMESEGVTQPATPQTKPAIPGAVDPKNPLGL